MEPTASFFIFAGDGLEGICKPVAAIIGLGFVAFVLLEAALTGVMTDPTVVLWAPPELFSIDLLWIALLLLDPMRDSCWHESQGD